MTSLIEDWEAQKQHQSKAGKIKIVGVIPESFSQDYVTNEKVKQACKGLLPNIQRLFLEGPIIPPPPTGGEEQQQTTTIPAPLLE